MVKFTEEEIRLLLKAMLTAEGKLEASPKAISASELESTRAVIRKLRGKK